RLVFRTDSSIAALSHGTIERRSINSTLVVLPILAIASRDFSMVLPHATSVTSEPLLRLRAWPNGTAWTGCCDLWSVQSRCLGIRKMTGSSLCIAVQSKPAASPDVLGLTPLSLG